MRTLSEISVSILNYYRFSEKLILPVFFGGGGRFTVTSAPKETAQKEERFI